MADPHQASNVHVHDAHAHDAYVRGSQEIGEQQSTFHAFIGMAKWGSLWIAALLTFLTLWFQPGGSFFGAAIGAGILLVAGWFFLKSPKKKH